MFGARAQHFFRGFYIYYRNRADPNSWNGARTEIMHYSQMNMHDFNGWSFFYTPVTTMVFRSLVTTILLMCARGVFGIPFIYFFWTCGRRMVFVCNDFFLSPPQIAGTLVFGCGFSPHRLTVGCFSPFDASLLRRIRCDDFDWIEIVHFFVRSPSIGDSLNEKFTDTKHRLN